MRYILELPLCDSTSLEDEQEVDVKVAGTGDT